KSTKARREAELGRLNRQIQELIRMRTAGLVTDREFLAQKSILSERQMVLESKPVAERLTADQVREHLGEITEPLSRLRETWTALPGPFRRRFDRLVLPVGFVAGESRTAELGLLFRALGDLSQGDSNGVDLTGEKSNRLLQEIQEFTDLFNDYFEFKNAPRRGGSN